MTRRNGAEVAEQLCAAMYRSGNTARDVAMLLNDLQDATGFAPKAIVKGLYLAERYDWINWNRSGVALKAAGIYVAKNLLSLPR